MSHKVIKKELVIICNNCYPIPSATGLLALNCARFLKDDFNIRIITLSNSLDEVRNFEHDGYTLNTISNLWLAFNNKFKTLYIQEKGFKKFFYKLLWNMVRIIRKIERTIIHSDNYQWFQEKASKVLEELNNERKIDVIISVSEPVRAHLIAEQFKINHKQVRWICYWGDLYATKYFKSNIFQTLKDMKVVEKRLVTNADFVLCNMEIYNHYSSMCTTNKISAVPYMLKEDILKLRIDNKVTTDKKTFIYYGSFSATMRNPKFMLELFLKSDYKLHLYSSGCESLIDQYVKLSNGRIKSYGFVNPSILQEKVFKADVLINISNSSSDFIPSKTLELISYRKPILDFYYGYNTKNMLDEYPLLLRIKNDSDTYKALELLEKFLSGNQNQIDQNIVTKIFQIHTEKNIEKIIKSSIFI